MTTIKNIAVLGSTGSIGTQTLDIVSKNPDRFKIKLLTARNNYELLAQQAHLFQPEIIVISNPDHYSALKELVADLDTKVLAGDQSICEAIEHLESDIVVTAMVGYSGLLPTISAIKTGKRIALANKETLVVGGELITSLKNQFGAEIVPVDSEHSAIFQSLLGEENRFIEKIILTASGGPFRSTPKELLAKVTKNDALRHPRWTMGAKVTIDSASMANKGFELIEARWLFDVEPDKISILVHPQSIVHSMVAFTDGCIKAQLGITDMRLPIGYALSYPERLHSESSQLPLSELANLTFELPDYDKFPMLTLALEAIKTGGNMPCILNAANEMAVDAFLKDKIRFTDIPLIVGKTMSAINFIKQNSLESLVETDRIARIKASELINKISI